MPVRRISQGGFAGYGVFGSLLAENAAGAVIDLGEEAGAIPLPLDPPQIPPDPVLTYSLTLIWRFTVQIILADFAILKQYSNPTGRVQYGRYVCSSNVYQSAEGFISYSDVKSPKFSCAFVWNELGFDVEPPCDEPQDDIVPDPGAVGGYVPYSGIPSYTSANPFTPFQGFNTDIADKVQLWFEPGVTLARVGVTYAFAFSGLRASAIEDEGRFVKINL